MYFTGFADEASKGIDNQIRAVKELGWNNIEARNVDGINIHDLPDEKFEEVWQKLSDAGVKINCFGSAIANWSKKIDEPFESSLAEIDRAIPRMKKLGTDLIRIMSFAILENRSPDDQMEHERFKRVREIHKRFLDAGITPVHENCMNYGGMGWPYTLKLIENVPGLKLVFDTGNPVVSDDRSKPEPFPKQSALEFYENVKEHIAYVHIKDAIWDAGKNKALFTYPNEGAGEIKKIVKDLLKSGYDGGFSIEPHMSVVHHDNSIKSTDELRYDNFIEYGRRFMELVKSTQKEIQAEKTFGKSE